MLDATLAEPGFVIRQGDSALGRVTAFELDQDGYRVSFTFRGEHTASCRQSHAHVLVSVPFVLGMPG